MQQHQLLEYLKDVAETLADLARTHDLSFSAHLYEMAQIEATEKLAGVRARPRTC